MAGKAKNKKYHFTCDCWVAAEDVRKYKYYHRCPDHLDSKIAEISFECSRCGETIVASKEKTMKSACDDCVIAKKKEYLCNRVRRVPAKSWRAEQKDAAMPKPGSREGYCWCGAKLNYRNHTGECLCHSEHKEKDWGRGCDRWLAYDFKGEIKARKLKEGE